MNRRVQVVLFTAMARKSSILKVQGVVDAIRKQLDDRLAIDRRAMDVFRWAMGCLLVLEFGGFLAKAETPVVKISISLADGTHFVADERVLTP